jgi:hypothetical protein
VLDEVALLLLSAGTGGSIVREEEAGGVNEPPVKAANIVDNLELLDKRPETLGWR